MVVGHTVERVTCLFIYHVLDDYERLHIMLLVKLGLVKNEIKHTKLYRPECLLKGGSNITLIFYVFIETIQFF